MPFLILAALLGIGSYAVITKAPHGSDDDLLSKQIDDKQTSKQKHMVGDVITDYPNNFNIYH